MPCCLIGCWCTKLKKQCPSLVARLERLSQLWSLWMLSTQRRSQKPQNCHWWVEQTRSTGHVYSSYCLQWDPKIVDVIVCLVFWVKGTLVQQGCTLCKIWEDWITLQSERHTSYLYESLFRLDPVGFSTYNILFGLLDPPGCFALFLVSALFNLRAT